MPLRGSRSDVHGGCHDPGGRTSPSTGGPVEPALLLWVMATSVVRQEFRSGAGSATPAAASVAVGVSRATVSR